MAAARRSAVLYHYPCPDGAFAALAAHLYFSAASMPVAFFPNTVYDPVRVENIHVEDFDDVYLLDFVGPPGFVEKLIVKAKRIIDMERSGATIAYDFFRDKLLGRAQSFGHDLAEGTSWPPGKLVHEDAVGRVSSLYKFIEDGDIWRWAIPDSKAFYSGLKDMNIEYNVNLNPSLFDQLLALDPEFVISHGKETLTHKQKLMEEVLKQSYEIAIGGGSFGHCLVFEAGSKIWKSKAGEVEQQQAKEEFVGAVKLLEGALRDRDYFGGESFGYLDAVAAPLTSWFPAFERFGGFTVEEECPGFAAWTKRCAMRESVAAALPDPDRVYELVCKMRKTHGVE